MIRVRVSLVVMIRVSGQGMGYVNEWPQFDDHSRECVRALAWGPRNINTFLQMC